MAIRVLFSVDRLSDVLTYFDQIAVYRSDTGEGGTYNELTSAGTRIALTPAQEQYYFYDEVGDDDSWYRARYYNSTSDSFGDSGTAVKGTSWAVVKGASPQERVGYTFGNYTPPNGEWGKIYTADDIRYTMLFGVDCIGSDIAQSEFTNEQLDQIVLEALSEFEAYLDMDIRRKMYKTFQSKQVSGIRARLWRDGIDYTNEDDPYDFDPQEWSHYGFMQLRHWPIIRVHRAVWLSPVQGQIIDMVEQKWLRVDKQFGQVRMFPTQGISYGPFSVYGQFWSGMGARRYPGGFEFDYETGYESADFVPEGLRSTIAKYATIKVLAAVGDGILAGFSSQSVSLDGLSESFSSTQSATSAYFGARIKQYSDEIKEWLGRNRYKYAPVGISFVGSR